MLAKLEHISATGSPTWKHYSAFSHRAGFAALLDRIEGNGVRVVIVEDASRFARELMAPPARFA